MCHVCMINDPPAVAPSGRGQHEAYERIDKCSDPPPPPPSPSPPLGTTLVLALLIMMASCSSQPFSLHLYPSLLLFLLPPVLTSPVRLPNTVAQVFHTSRPLLLLLCLFLAISNHSLHPCLPGPPPHISTLSLPLSVPRPLSLALGFLSSPRPSPAPPHTPRALANPSTGTDEASALRTTLTPASSGAPSALGSFPRSSFPPPPPPACLRQPWVCGECAEPGEGGDKREGGVSV